MEQLKVRKKEIIVVNSIVYLFLSIVFLYLQYAYRHQLSPFSLVYFRKSVELFWYVGLSALITAFLLWKHHKHSLFLFSASLAVVGFLVIEGLFIEFNKIIVVALFFFVVISYFLYQLLDQYFTQASINANFSLDDLFEPLLKKIPCDLMSGETELQGYLTNWDENGCFVRIEGAFSTMSKVEIRIRFAGKVFHQEGEVVAESQDLRGVGIKFKSTSKELNAFNWSEFSELIHELGFLPERLR